MSVLGNFKLNAELVENLLVRKYGVSGSVEKILHDWESSSLVSENHQPPDRSTIYRWKSGNLPRSPHDLIALCSLLNVDPFSILVVTKKAQILNGILGFSIGRSILWNTPSLSFVKEFYGRQPIWPPPSLGPSALPFREYYPNGWFTYDFAHDAKERIGFYRALSLETGEEADGLPRVWHFAYRPAIATGRWLHYGVISRMADALRLLNVRGYLIETQSNAERKIFAETWFGPEPAEFRIASLHPFECKIETPPADQTALRFAG